MIEINGVNKSFGSLKALDNIIATIQEGSIFGLVGTNGAGKSTLLRILCGVLKADTGTALIDGEDVYENPHAKEKVCFLSDTAYFFPNATIRTMQNYYEIVYPNFNSERFEELVEKFGLDRNRKINSFSKGMKKQVSVLLGICTGTKYLLCDETFDGLDPVMRQAVKSIFAMELMNRQFTPVIASHSLRELEDICDHVGLLYKGGILLSKDLEDMKFHIHKVQCVIQDPVKEEELLTELHVLQHDKRGSLLTVVARGTKQEILMSIEDKHPIFSEVLPLTLEEIFISETEVAGYDIKNLIL
ncbi:ABC transporter ATP-binding protein [Hominisplanchenecus murintestinalis]|uniref:ABC transporter ATP-binding protein n=1 Tax=Hominisplanchenecus murintestinalis TaxID=2941517 RepID=A0AC61QY66_9FIRM|nr:ABC transporter ATP-binding protein [Hominisplanchenecus murintestinalis]TGX98038.1 ABC transporter ATP-binding protein [Hominisplanchenecus murintestinalis]